MSIISSYDVDNSADLAKRFASLATSYIDDPALARSETAKVPLENLFRILEMFRYDAFADESRRGVLALGGFGQRPTPRPRSSWHITIEAALQKALSDSFASVPKAAAIEELQSSLRDLAQKGELSAAQAQKLKAFFKVFGANLG
jgi:hypothetical protein